uniref:PE-PGRS family protein n=2 Tax=Streptomyces auratus AGR0001 TaxID=1160718 RepID=J2K431_9ACTN
MATIMLPVEVDWVLDLLGFQWPNIDEDKMRDAAEAWSSFAASVRAAQQQGESATQAVRGANSGEAIEAFENKWKKFSGDGFLDESAEAAEALAIVLQIVATIIMVMKLAVIAQLIALAFEFAAAQAAAPVTLGASEAGAAAATATTRVMVRQIISKAKTQILQAIKDALAKKVKRSGKEMVTDLAKEMGIDVGKKLVGNLATQGIKSHFGAQKGFDFGAAGEAAAKPFVDKGKEVVDAYHGMGEVEDGLGKMAHGDVLEGAKQAYEGEQKAAKVAKTVRGVTHKDAEPTTSGDGTSSEGGDGGSSEGGSGSSSSSSSSEGGSGSSSEGGSQGSSSSGAGGSSDGGSGSSSSSGSGSDGSNSSSAAASAASAGGAARSRAESNTNTDNDGGQDEAARVRNAFG